MEPTPEQLAAGEPKGLTPAMCAYLRGETPEELSADANAFLSAFAPPAPPAPPAPRSGGNRGPDVASTGSGVAAGAARYRADHGIDEDGRREPTRPGRANRNPFAENDYVIENH
ncbi:MULTISPECIES: hypothetical protein [unclassified Streptomyces]|uniref:hypothetical protein n=1 Tax=unclassified Streptomyces TaxID=2593676 RepID=UPI000ABCB14C|nr:hypothetical protein [Streptomyces sp. TSRI0107]